MVQYHCKALYGELMSSITQRPRSTLTTAPRTTNATTLTSWTRRMTPLRSKTGCHSTSPSFITYAPTGSASTLNPPPECSPPRAAPDPSRTPTLASGMKVTPSF
jgi:hypothetical protein